MPERGGLLDAETDGTFDASMTIRVDAPAEHVRSWQYGDEFGVEAEATLDPETALALAQAEDVEFDISPDPTDWLSEVVTACGPPSAFDFFAVRVLGLSVDRWASLRGVLRETVRTNVREAEGALGDAE